MVWRIAYARQRMAIMVSKFDHCWLELLEQEQVELVLARYMKIPSPALVERYPNRIIDLHHSFLPAFVGANSYRHAWRRGVKLIGATSHYVTAVLDGGPIIDQDVTGVSH